MNQRQPFLRNQVPPFFDEQHYTFHSPNELPRFQQSFNATVTRNHSASLQNRISNNLPYKPAAEMPVGIQQPNMPYRFSAQNLFSQHMQVQTPAQNYQSQISSESMGMHLNMRPPIMIPRNTPPQLQPGMPVQNRMSTQSIPPRMQQLNIPPQLPLSLTPFRGQLQSEGDNRTPLNTPPIFFNNVSQFPSLPKISHPLFEQTQPRKLADSHRQSFRFPPFDSDSAQSSTALKDLYYLPPIKQRRNADQLIVEQFLSKVGKLNHMTQKNEQTQCKRSNLKTDKATIFSEKRKLKICEAKQLQMKAHQLIEKLEKLSLNFQENAEDISKYKKKLEEVLAILSDEEVIKDLCKKVLQRKKKRQQIKLLKEKAYLEKEAQKQKVEESNRKISEWQEKERAKLDERRREEEMQGQLDRTLAELRREMNTVTKSLEILHAVTNLRRIRVNVLKAKGQDPPNKTDAAHYNNASKAARETLQSYKESCASKINSIKLFVEAEQNQAKLEIEKQNNRKLLEKQKKIEEQRNRALFGKPDQLNPFDPMWPVQELHKQANLNLSNLIQYRRIWDQYLHEDGSSIPVDWVEPPEPSSADWAKYKVD